MNRTARVILLGTGTSHGVPIVGCSCATCRSPDPRDQRLRSSIYLAVEDGPAVLVDTSTDLRQQALRHNITRLDAILYTHSHADHIMGLDDVRRFNVLKGGKLVAYADGATADDLRRTFQYVFDARPTAKGLTRPELDLRTIDGPFDVDGLRVVPVPLLHGSRRILGFRFGSLAYLTDCSAIPDESWPLLTGIDTVVIDALRNRPHPSHFTVAEALDAIARLAPRRALLTHICHELNHAATSDVLPPGVELAYDGLHFDVAVE